MTKEETIHMLQQVLDDHPRDVLVRVHIGTVIHALKYLKEQEEEIKRLRLEMSCMENPNQIGDSHEMGAW